MDQSISETIFTLKNNYTRCISGIGDKHFCQQMQKPIISEAKKYYTNEINKQCVENKFAPQSCCADVKKYVDQKFGDIYE